MSGKEGEVEGSTQTALSFPSNEKSTSLLLTGMKEPAYTLDAMISDTTMPKKYCRIGRKRQTKEKILSLVRIKIPKVISKDYLSPLSRKCMEEVSAFH